jgi:hypothetical protein
VQLCCNCQRHPDLDARHNHQVHAAAQVNPNSSSLHAQSFLFAPEEELVSSQLSGYLPAAATEDNPDPDFQHRYLYGGLLEGRLGILRVHVSMGLK